MARREQHIGNTVVEAMLIAPHTRSVVISTAADDKLDLILRIQMRQVGPQVSVGLPGAWGLEIWNLNHFGRYMFDTQSTAGFHRHGERGISEALHELKDIGLR